MTRHILDCESVCVYERATHAGQAQHVGLLDVVIIRGIYRHDDGRWWVDKVVGGRRLQKAFGTNYAEAQEWLFEQLNRIRTAREGGRPRFTFEEASCRYLQERESKPSLEDEILYLKLAMPYVGALWLDEICDETLEPLVSALKAPVVTKRKDGKETVRVRKNKTVNLVLGTIQQVLNSQRANGEWKAIGGSLGSVRRR